MKIQCDVCDKYEASVFCVADEAALCAACDHRVHHANKLAGKHNRFSLHQPEQAPLCDICKEKRAFLFCQQDRAILCKGCDFQIHKSNELTRKHARFLLTGIKLSATSNLYSESPSSTKPAAAVANEPDKTVIPKRTPINGKGTTPQSAPAPSLSEKSLASSISKSSISEYLIETLPGWHVDDFLDCSSASHNGFFKAGEEDLLPFWDSDLDRNMSVLSSETMGFWVPQVPPPPPPPPVHQTQNQSYPSLQMLGTNGFKGNSKDFAYNHMKSGRKRNEDNSFAVPQMTAAIKRSRTFW